MKQESYFTVSSLNRFIKTLFDSVPELNSLSLRGEISNFKKYSSGHCYFTLKDNSSNIPAVMFQTYASKLTFDPKDGDEVIVYGSVSVYPQRGAYQFYALEMELYGQGTILLELEKLKKKLASEGLFDESRKRDINLYPKAIGLVTAPNSAAVKDLIFNIHRRYPICDIYVFPCLVQGNEAPKSLLDAFNKALAYPLDTIIIGRGGGASEDLSAFNDESLVRAVANSTIPTISAVGHEIDMTLIDYVSDKRASTPTGAAELATIDQREIKERLMYAKDALIENMEVMINDYKDEINQIKARPFFINPSSIYKEKKVELSHLKTLLINDMNNLLRLKKQNISNYEKRLMSLNPYSVLKRGYSITEDENGKVLTSVKEIKINQMIKTSLQDGSITSKVEERELNKNGKEKR